jgi:hypothetical protein
MGSHSQKRCQGCEYLEVLGYTTAAAGMAGTAVAGTYNTMDCEWTDGEICRQDLGIRARTRAIAK